MTRKAVLLLATVLGVSLSAAQPASSQSFPTDDPVLKRIWTLGMDSSRTEQLASALLDSLGPRLTGSPNVRAAQDWLVRTYKALGIDAKNERYGTWRSWRRGVSHVDLLTPRVRTLEATMVGFSPGTGGRNLVAGVVILPHFADSTEFVTWLPKARGKLVLVSAPQPTCRPTEEWAQFGTPASRTRLDSLRAALVRDWGTRDVRGTGYSLALGGGELGLRLEKAGVAGLLTSRPKNAWGTREIFETYNTRAPVVSLSCEDYGLVFRLAERDRNPRLRLDLESQFLGEQPVFNTIATIPGTEKPDEYVLLSAHFDSWDGGSGATDNGTGSITMMEAMRILKQAYPHPKRTIRVGHWTGEEMGLVGSKAYREDHPEVVKGLQAVYNNDNGTGRIVRLGATGFPNGDVHMRQWLEKIPTEFRSQINYVGVGVPGTGGSDDFSFYCDGTPSFGLGGLSWDYGSYTWHTERDTYDKIVFDDLKANATLTAMLVYLASEDPEKISRARTDLAAVADSVLRARAASPPAEGAALLPPPLNAWPECGTAPRSTRPRLK
ncbi:MAG: peptidase [Gemmatimonadetes bacterium]|nr:peptidase [Gemmatimonadota bacterium]